MRAWRDTERNILVNRYRAGDAFEEIAQRLNRTEAEIKRELRRLGEIKKTARPDECLKCGRPFKSKGVWNWVCPNCREQNTRLHLYPESPVSRKVFNP